MMMTRFTAYEIEFRDSEKHHMEETNEIIEAIVDIMEEDEVHNIVNPATGEVIGRDDLCRLRGILSGLLGNTGHWVDL